MAGNPTYQKYKKLGVCVRCGGTRASGTVLCETHRQEANARGRKWHQDHPGEIVTRNKKYRANNPHKARGWLYARYGLSAEDVARILEVQEGKCAICRTPLDTYHIDHNHATGTVRGLLCQHCNLGLGHFKDNPEALETAASYLRSF